MDLRAQDVARLLGVAEETVIRWARTGRLAAHHFDDQVRFNRVELQECARALGRPLPAGIFSPPSGAAPGAARARAAVEVRLSDALGRGGIHHGVGGATCDEVLNAIAELPGLPATVDRALLAQLLRARERVSSTGIGNGVAVPHPRDPLVVRVEAPAVVLALLEAPVDFGAIDGRPVHTVFTLLTPSVRAHLQLLSAVAYALADAELVALLAARASASAILARLRELESSRTEAAS